VAPDKPSPVTAAVQGVCAIPVYTKEAVEHVTVVVAVALVIVNVPDAAADELWLASPAYVYEAEAVAGEMLALMLLVYVVTV
jgi:hypothetical protein